MAEILFWYKYRLKKGPWGVPGPWMERRMSFAEAEALRDSGDWDVERIE